MVPDPYETLNLPRTAGETEIKRSYRQLARKYHPDTWSEPCFSDAERREASARFAEISAAHALLLDEKRRAEYDRLHRYGGGREETAEDSPPRHTKRQQPERGPPPSPSSAPPPPPPRRTADDAAPPPLPRGWTSAVDPSTGCAYYYNTQTGQTSWQHPAARRESPATTDDNSKVFGGGNHAGGGGGGGDYYSRLHENLSHAARRPDNHHGEALCSLCLFPPVGLIAAYHSWQVDRCWQRGRYGEAVHHARQAPRYACLGNALGVAFWLCWIFLYRRDGAPGNDHRFEWPDFDFKWD